MAGIRGNEMFFSSTPVVEFVDLKENQVVFLSKKPLRLGRDTPVRLAAQTPEGKSQVVSSRIYVERSRPVAGGQTAYIGTLQSELPFAPVAHPNADSSALRRGERLDCSLRVMSPDLEGFSGVSVDLSLTGLQLETRQAQLLGKVVQLRIESTMEGMEFIVVNARVAWCRREGQKSFRSGLEFRDLNPEIRAQLAVLGRFLRLREPANLTQLVLECADSYLLGSSSVETEA